MNRVIGACAILGAVSVASCMADDEQPQGDGGAPAGGESGGASDPSAGAAPRAGAAHSGGKGGAVSGGGMTGGGTNGGGTTGGGTTGGGTTGGAMTGGGMSGSLAGEGGNTLGGAGAATAGNNEGGLGGTAGASDGGAPELAWPLTATSLPSECSPSCESGTCHEECAAGTYPCDSGCCASTITIAEAPAGDNYVNRTSLWLDASDHAHLAYTATIPFYARSSDQSWETDSISVRGLPIAEDEQVGPLFDKVNKPYLALDSAGEVYAAYGMFDSGSDTEYDWLAFGPAAGPYAHEDLPSAPRGLTVTDGDHVSVLFDHQILERTGASTFLAIAPPSSGLLRSFAFADHHYFVLAQTEGQLELLYRNALGAWGSEEVPVAAGGAVTLPSLVVEHGMAYVSYAQDAKLHLARRGQAGWQTWPVPVLTGVPMESAFAIDDCGAPHLLVWETSAGVAGWDDRYLRWTTSGWRSFSYDAGCYFGDGVSIAVTGSHAILASASCTATIVTVPRTLP
ncbi:MAG: hypothetical protein ABUL60_20995 [Myxococcales bacterium]